VAAVIESIRERLGRYRAGHMLWMRLTLDEVSELLDEIERLRALTPQDDAPPEPEKSEQIPR